MASDNPNVFRQLLRVNVTQSATGRANNNAYGTVMNLLVGKRRNRCGQPEEIIAGDVLSSQT
jgi:hypothetical protein